jgi:hypothetical protein
MNLTKQVAKTILAQFGAENHTYKINQIQAYICGSLDVKHLKKMQQICTIFKNFASSGAIEYQQNTDSYKTIDKEYLRDICARPNYLSWLKVIATFATIVTPIILYYLRRIG